MNNKIVLHVGGIYGDKEAALERFATNFKRLPEAVQNRLIIENDDRLYNIEEVLGLAYRLQIPAVYDNLHHAINPPPSGGTDRYWIAEAKKTWKAADGKQKIHYSQQAPGKRPGAHTDTIQLDTFLTFHKQLEDQQIDIMLEVKDKNLSAVKCQNATTTAPRHGVAGKRVGPLQIRCPRTVARGLSSHPHAVERQRGLSGPGILPPDRRCLHRRTPPRVRRKCRSPRLGLLQKARDRSRAQAVRKESCELPQRQRNARDLETSPFQVGAKI